MQSEEYNFSEDRLDSLLAPYATLHSESGGRIHGQEPHPYRSCYQRDRDRIIHSKAFRRLGYKTQVFINSAGDNYRTRLTHSLEVAQISRSVCAALRLNSDFAEALALAHDLGHTPFGHAGQDALNELMKAHGGFEHNHQSLRIVSFLDSRYLDYRGLNLTRATLKGMMKHASIYECDEPELLALKEERQKERPALEAALVDQCDRIAYVHHDLEDGLDSRILELDELFGLPFWKDAWQNLSQKKGKKFEDARTELRIRSTIRELMNECISDLLQTTKQNLLELQPSSAKKARQDARKKEAGKETKEKARLTLSDIQALSRKSYPVAFGPSVRERIRILQGFLYERLYRHPEVMQMSRRGARIIETLFEEFQKFPELLPRHYQSQIADTGRFRVVADYISGMTDRFAYAEYARLTGASLS